MSGRQHGARTDAARPGWAAQLTIVALGLVILIAIITRSFGAYLATAAPETALVLYPNNPPALVALAQQTLVRAFQPSADAPRAADTPIRLEGLASSFARARSEAGTADIIPEDVRRTVTALAQRALSADPLNAAALRLLGQMADADGDEERAEQFMTAAARLSAHEAYAAYWLLDRRFAQGRQADALAFADRLLRTRPDLAGSVTTVLARLAETEAARDPLVALLAEGPPWRRSFFAHLTASISDARTPLLLMIALKDGQHAPTAAELNGYLTFLMRRNFQELAYYAWLKFMPPDQLAKLDLLYNGDFESAPSGAPFDWQFSAGAGASIDIVGHPDRAGGRALAIEFWQGRVAFGGVSQTVLLGPGSYRLEGSHKIQLTGRRGLKWRINCVGTRAVIGEGDMVVSSGAGMTAFSVPFHVPREGCRGQEVRLGLDVRSASEQLVTGRALYADLSILRE